jgi:hypothetical protein
MPLVKLTLPTALPAVRQAIAELGKAVKDAAPLQGLDVVSRGLERLDEHCGRKGLDLELVTIAPLSEPAAERAAAWIGRGFPAAPLKAATLQPSLVDLPAGEGTVAARVRVSSLDAGTALAAGTPRPAVLLLIAGASAAVTAEALARLEPLLQDRPRVFLIGPVSDPALKPLEELARSVAWGCGVVDAERFPDTTLAAHLSSPPWDSAHELFRAYSAVVGLDSLAGVFSLWMEQQGRELRTRRAATQAKLGGRGTQAGGAARPAAGAPDLSGEIKARIQRHSQEFERGAAERLQDLLSVPAGRLAREAESMLLGLDELSEEERTTKIETRIPEAFLDKLVRTLRERIARHCAADLVALNDLFRLLAQEIEREIAQAQGPPFVPQFAYLTEDRVRRMLDMAVAVQVQYHGELPHQGFSEYFASVRKYSMILVMAASMFGMSSLMRQYREITVPLTIMLVIGGTYSVISSTRRQRVENLERELDAARTALRPEVKRVFGDVQKAWSTLLVGSMNEQIGRALADLDAAVKDHQARRGAEASPERERLQRQLAQLDAVDKRLALLGKERDAVASGAAQFRSELRGLLPRPGVPGAAAAPAALRPGAPAAAASGAPSLSDVRARAEALKAQSAAAPSAAASALAEAKAKMAALRASAPAAAAGEAKPSAVEAARARLAEMKASLAEKKTAAAPPPTAVATAGAATPPAAAPSAAPPAAPAPSPPAQAAGPVASPAGPGEPPKPVSDARARLEALKAQAAARKAAQGAPPKPGE